MKVFVKLEFRIDDSYADKPIEPTISDFIETQVSDCLESIYEGFTDAKVTEIRTEREFGKNSICKGENLSMPFDHVIGSVKSCKGCGYYKTYIEGTE